MASNPKGPHAVDDDVNPLDDPAFLNGKWYAFRVQRGSFIDRSNQKGTPYIRIPVLCSAGDMVGAKVDYDMYLTPKMVKKNESILELMGFNPRTAKVPDDWQNLDDFISGAEVEGRIEIVKFNEKEQCRIANFRQKRGETEEALISEFAQLFKGEGGGEKEEPSDDDFDR